MANFYVDLYFTDTSGKPRLRIEELKDYNDEIMRAVGRTIREVLCDGEKVTERTRFYVGWLGQGWSFDVGGFADSTHEGKHLVVMDEKLVNEHNIRIPTIKACAKLTELTTSILLLEMKEAVLLEMQEKNK